MPKLRKYLLTLLLLVLAACNSSLARLEQVGKTPPLEAVENPVQKPNYKPVIWPSNGPARKKTVNSLWQPGARAFFRDQRARRVGDILKITVKIEDKADLDNKTNRTRDSKDNIKAPNVFGLESKLSAVLPSAVNAAKLLDISGANSASGSGTIARKETIQTQIAAMVTQILPNGNLVVHGSQEIRVNFEVREVTVEGIVRPEDISSENGISSDQIAEARISYGGRGQITDVQQPRIGNQILDIVSPF
jgi:flagellar L-ring protein precursor FlgH